MVVPGIPGLRAVPDVVTIHPILPPTVHLHPCILLASSSLLVEVYSSLPCEAREAGVSYSRCIPRHQSDQVQCERRR